MKNSEKYKEIIKYIEARLGLMTALQNLDYDENYSKNITIIEKRQQEIDNWLNKESVDKR